ncbi:MAG: hypothetical protein WD227_17950 [Vicinamibacterales bacterium]
MAVTVVSTAPVLAQTTSNLPTAQQPRLEIVSQVGEYYWVVATYSDGSRRGGWIPRSIVQQINSHELRPIPSAPPEPPPAVPAPVVPNDYDGLVLALQDMRAKIDRAATATSGLPDAASLNERSRRISDAIALLQSLAADQGSGPPAVVQPFVTRPRVQPVPVQTVVAQPLPSPRRPHAREGFWFSAGLGFGSLGCRDCVGRDDGLSGGLSLGGTINDRLLFGVGTTGFAKTVLGDTLSLGTVDARLRFYPQATSGFHINVGVGFGSVSFADITDTGIGVVLGMGWDIRMGRNVSLTPFWNGIGLEFDGGDANFGQIGIGFTIH